MKLLNLLVCRWRSFQVSKFNSIQFIFAMFSMEAAKMTIRSSKFNVSVKNSKRKKQPNTNEVSFFVSGLKLQQKQKKQPNIYCPRN